MLLKNILYQIRKTDIILFSIYPLNKSKISETVSILSCLIECMGLKSIVKDKVVSIKDNYLTIKNITHAIYQKQNKLDDSFKFS